MPRCVCGLWLAVGGLSVYHYHYHYHWVMVVVGMWIMITVF